jgi:hypothetical protein
MGPCAIHPAPKARDAGDILYVQPTRKIRGAATSVAVHFSLYVDKAGESFPGTLDVACNPMIWGKSRNYIPLLDLSVGNP